MNNAIGSTQAKGTVIRFERVSKSFTTNDGGTFQALDNLSLAVSDNEFFTLLGPSGCGKTTLLRLLAGFESPDSGAVLLNGKTLAGIPANRRPVNTVFQSYALFPHLTVAENVGFGLRMQGIPKGIRHKAIADMLDLVHLTDKADHKPAQLSGGQQQRVALARALAPEPQVLLLDEPLSALDLKLRKDMQIEMKRIQRESHTTFLFVTHDQEEALTMSDRIAVIDHGQVQQIGTPEEIYQVPANTFVAAFIGEMNFINVDSIHDGGCNGLLAHTQIGCFQVSSHIAQAEKIAHGLRRLAIRPERCQITVGTLQGDAINSVLGHISNAVFTGPHATVFFRPKAASAEIRIRIPADEFRSELATVGGVATVTLPAASLMVLPA